LLPPIAWTLLQSSLRLTRRELQIVHGIFDDQTETSIAAQLGISHHTVNTYLQRLYRKLSACSRPQLILRIVAEYLAQRSGSSVRLTDEDAS
jgi:DNA-binding CsgD family transcriptional regulator